MIKDVLFDVDGVFTNGQFTYSKSGKVTKVFAPHDSDGVKFLRFLGVNVFAITADKRGFNINEARMNDLDIPLSLVSEENRFQYVKNHFNFQTLAFMGDGLFDAKIIKWAFLGIAPANATRPAKIAADYVTKLSGGSGAVFEASFYIGKKFFATDYQEFLQERGLNAEDF